ncbi:MAG: FadR family transcriptional regulator [Pirellulales bacterium]|nr:FadR family transcriptional regulator [Pirellulales bacterium]
MREQILSNSFGADGVLPSEGEMARAFRVSQTVIRGAMHILRAEGLIDVSQGRRPQVRPVDPVVAVQSFQSVLQRSDTSLLALVEARKPLEAEIAALAAQRATDSQIAAIVEAYRRLESADNLEDQVHADMEFHDLLAAASGNAVFQIFLTTVTQLLRLSLQTTITRVGQQRALEGHRDILAAVKAGDAQAAREAMLHHLAMAAEDLQD